METEHGSSSPALTFRVRGERPRNLVSSAPGCGTLPNILPYSRQSHRAEWTRGEGIRRLIAGHRPCGLFHFAPGLGNPSGCSLGVRSGPTRMRAAPPRYPPDPCRALRGFFDGRADAWGWLRGRRFWRVDGHVRRWTLIPPLTTYHWPLIQNCMDAILN